MAMNRFEHLLACIGEEAGEVQQAVGKALRFGLGDTGPGQEKQNHEQLYTEIHDLIAVYEMLHDLYYCGPGLVLNRDLIEQKKAKVEHYIEYSLTSGG